MKKKKKIFILFYKIIYINLALNLVLFCCWCFVVVVVGFFVVGLFVCFSEGLSKVKSPHYSCTLKFICSLSLT